ncbi:hypothetical protein BDK92_0279 [Micromonospora pisi]|uniref:Uncharacterized protein n=1 Tax=Micromonospora pisi TaxID=589240 RepID=A0A495JC20_9ACTN|nr:hypothetical protein BDK92_0279 [Micromonospora pisi]
MAWWRNRFVWVAVILLGVSATVVLLVERAGSGPASADHLFGQLDRRLVATLEQLEPEQHQGHGEHARDVAEETRIVCGVRVFGVEPAEATTVSEVRTAYGFHLCGVAEPNRPWDWAVKLVGPIVVAMDSEPPVVQVAEATTEVPFVERVRQLFPERYQEQALKESLGEQSMRELRQRYDQAAGL